MADYAILTVSNAASPVNGRYSESRILYGRWGIPFFWLALFRVENVMQVKWDEVSVAAPYMMEQRSICLANLVRRERSIFQALPESQQFVFCEFYRCLDQAPEEYVHCDPQFAGIATASSLDRWLKECLIAFDGPPPIRKRTGVGAFFLGSGLTKGWENMIGRRPTAFEASELAGASDDDVFSWEKNSE